MESGEGAAGTSVRAAIGTIRHLTDIGFDDMLPRTVPGDQEDARATAGFSAESRRAG
jgi:hypothetical protein